MALTDKLTAIADAIRGKTGKTDGLTLDAMPGEIAGIQTGGGGEHEQCDGVIMRTATSYYNDRITLIGTNAFTGTPLADVICPNVTLIGGSAFQRCNALTEITDRNFPKLQAITGDYTFGNCTSLVYFQSSTWERRTSGRTFQGSALKKLDISALTMFSANLCYNCGSLETVILRKTDTITTLAATNAFDGTKIKSGEGYIYCPSALIEEYKAATNWSTYANQFRAIEDYPEICGVSE